jgi:hypothetical protein
LFRILVACYFVDCILADRFWAKGTIIGTARCRCMTNIVPALKENIASVQAEIKRVRGKAKKERAQPLRLQATTSELRGLNVRLNSLEQNLAAADIPMPVTNSGC